MTYILKPFSTAPKDRRILARVSADQDQWAGMWFDVCHEGYLSLSGYDMGWQLYPGYGGADERMFDVWMEIPSEELAEA